mgnify:CR=1 FL=1
MTGEAAREAARRRDGRFGEQERDEAEVDVGAGLSTGKVQSCCPGGPFSGHRAWCASDEAQALRAAGASAPIAPPGRGSQP